MRPDAFVARLCNRYSQIGFVEDGLFIERLRKSASGGGDAASTAGREASATFYRRYEDFTGDLIFRHWTDRREGKSQLSEQALSKSEERTDLRLCPCPQRK
jgi:hypothetical protein